MSVWIDEPGVRFGPFEEAGLFHIEQSPGLAGLGDGIKKVEFVFNRLVEGGSEVLFVEAKNSIPRDTDDFFCEIKQKMLDSLVLWVLAVANRHEVIHNELPEVLAVAEAVQKPIFLILVVPEIPDSYLPTATDKFRSAMNKDCRLWGINPYNVWVLNLTRAEKFGLVVPELAPD